MRDRAAPSLYLTLADQGPESESRQLSRPRRAFLALCAVLILAATPLFWSGAAQAGDSGPQALTTSSGPGKDGHGGGDDDNSGPGGGHGGDDDDDDDTATRGTGTRNADADTTSPGTDTGTNGTGTRDTDDTGTRGQTRTGRDRATGHDTGGLKTDRGGLDTGMSTRGETDRGDHTGQTERR